MVTSHAEPRLSCTWSSAPRAHPGWKQWELKRGPDNMHNVYILWCSRWWMALKLIRQVRTRRRHLGCCIPGASRAHLGRISGAPAQNLNVLSLDIDAVMLTDIYPLLRGPPFDRQDVIITRNSDGSQSLNCGFVYFNRDASAHTQSRPAECGSAGGGGHVAESVPAAEWVASLMWERILLFLEVDKAALKKPPAREVLWEQARAGLSSHQHAPDVHQTYIMTPGRTPNAYIMTPGRVE